ncbi:MAG TPA: hypothetical protein VE758_02260 [Chthoniobacterales bacterium]|nr:hypothetical protein [Chthoniobacterales bacterium]
MLTSKFTGRHGEVSAVAIPVVLANTPHRFVNSGDTTLRQIDIHASPRFIQTNLE